MASFVTKSTAAFYFPPWPKADPNPKTAFPEISCGVSFSAEEPLKEPALPVFERNLSRDVGS